MIEETSQIPTNSNYIQINHSYNKYKLFLFQDLYFSLKNNLKINKDIPLILSDFITKISKNKIYISIFLKMIDNYLLNSPSNAIFFAEKLLTLLDHHKISVYLLSECYFLEGDFVKVNFLFHKYMLTTLNENYLILAAKSLIKIKKYEQAIKTLNFELTEPLNDSDFEGEKYYLLGKCNQVLENQEEAERNYYESLKFNPTSFCSFENYIQVKEINIEEIKKLLKELNYPKNLSWVKDYYKLLIDFSKRKFDSKINRSPSKTITFEMDLETDNNPPSDHKIIKELLLKENTHLLYLKAKQYFNNYQINHAFEISNKILDKNYFHFENLLIYSEILVEKRMISDLFTCSTNLAENYPEHFITFHIFGMYYFLLKKYEQSRKFFNKAIQLNKDCLKSWIMLGHSFANQEESEQAMNVYRSCIRLFPNSHLPHIYIGMEYLRINNLKTALLSFEQAHKIVGEDPIVHNEIGCIYLKEKDYIKAKKSFNQALKNCQTDGILWLKHIILNNLANAHRKYKEHQQAIECYEKSLSLCPEDPAVLFSLAFCYHLIQKLEKAIVLYHKVVIMKYDTHFVNHMLMKCLNDLASKK